MNKELIKNLNEYFDTYKESIRMLESGSKKRSTYPSYGPFYRIKDIVKEIATKNGLYLDTKHSNTEFTTIGSRKYRPKMAIYYNDNSKKFSYDDGVYVYIMYPNKDLKEIIISIELGRNQRFSNKEDIYINCINRIKELIPKEYIDNLDTKNPEKIILEKLDIDRINDFETTLIKMFEIYKIIIKKINEIDGKNYNEKYNNFINLISNGKCNIKDQDEINTSYNTIYYGIPGSGKSYYIKNELLNELKVKEYERIIFYPEYTYSDFVGTYRITANKENSIKQVAGPFTRILIKALKDESSNYALVIEEMNRGNAEAIFGDIFQLLDRENGESEYPINNDFIKECMQSEKINEKDIKIPKNLYIIATINTSDQNVFNLDTAFGRRWDYMRIDDYFSIEYDKEKYSEKYIKGFSNVKWNDFRTSINEAILDPENNIWNKEDKQLGLFYISKNQLRTEKQNTEDEEEERRKFVYKVIRYLWFDVFKNEEEKLINVLNSTNLTEEELKLCYSFDELAIQIIYKYVN